MHRTKALEVLTEPTYCLWGSFRVRDGQGPRSTELQTSNLIPGHGHPGDQASCMTQLHLLGPVFHHLCLI